MLNLNLSKNIYRLIATLSIQPVICIETYAIKLFEMQRPTQLIYNTVIEINNLAD